MDGRGVNSGAATIGVGCLAEIDTPWVMTMNYEDHPIANLVPMMEPGEFAGLVTSMRSGFDPEHPIVLFEGKILNGRHRYRAAREAGVEPIFIEFDGDDPHAFVWREDIDRRHLKEGARGVLGVIFAEHEASWKEERARGRAAAEKRLRESAESRRDPSTGRLTSRVSIDTPQAVAPISFFDDDEPDPEEDEGPPTCRASGCEHVVPEDGDLCRDCQIAHDDALELQRQQQAREAEKRKRRERDAIAEKAGVSSSTVARAQALKAKAPEAFAKVAQGKVTLNKAIAAVKLDEKKALAAKLNAKPLPSPTGPFDVITLDPPWRYETGRNATDPSHRGNCPYPDMSIEQICALPVAKLANPNCALWLWTTNAFMRQAYQCLDAWGFTEKTILTWAKDRMGVGDWLRGQTEHCILAVRGKPIVTLTYQSTLLSAPVREHSRKPDQFYALVEALCPGTRLEMFSRQPRQGWASWGAETQKFSAEGEGATP